MQKYAIRTTTGAQRLWAPDNNRNISKHFVQFCAVSSIPPKSLFTVRTSKYTTHIKKKLKKFIACVASVSVGFGSKELQRENGASKRRGRGRGRTSWQTSWLFTKTDRGFELGTTEKQIPLVAGWRP